MNEFILSIETQADIYLQLAKLDEAGFSPFQALELLLKTGEKYRAKLQQMLQLANEEKPIADDMDSSHFCVV